MTRPMAGPPRGRRKVPPDRNLEFLVGRLLSDCSLAQVSPPF